jgi:nucleotide-binding universal stress UspA family protein
VALDGSATAEQVLPHVHEIASKFGSEVTLLSAPEGSQSDDFPDKVKSYLDRIAQLLLAKGVSAEPLAVESSPVQAILSVCKEQGSDLIMLVSHGVGGVERQEQVRLGSVVDSLLQEAPCPIFLVSALPERELQNKS